MKTLVKTGGLLLLLSAGCSSTKGPRHNSVQEWEALQRAVPAYERAAEYKDAGVALFEPRYLDLEKARDEVNQAAYRGSTSDVELADTQASSDFATCVSKLQIYRIDREIEQSDSEPVQRCVTNLHEYLGESE